MRDKIKKYIEKIKSFDLFNYFIKKRVLSLEHSKELQQNMIEAFRWRIAEKKTEEKSLQGKILHARNLIVGYNSQLEKINMVVEMYN
ncbi:hypothetical protein LCGC14_2900320 [marine sediment metagenome]|uniref:Uncharacterized protein n=1 Tax=marine sediment metagenome TaxID=412755 RepID=A0A0F8XUZ0_9ZZZZ